MNLIAILVAILIVALLIWAARTLLGVSGIPEPLRTIIWVIVVVIAVLLFLQIAGLYNFGVHLH